MVPPSFSLDYDPADFAEIDAHALSVPSSVKNSVEELAAYLTEPSGSDLEKVRSIYRWVTENIRYDMNAYFTGRYGNLSADGVLRSGSSICSGYSVLFQSLCDAAGVEVVTINGYAKGMSYREGSSFNRTNHAWNAVKLNGVWFLIDSTWGSGYANGRRFVKEYDEFWFLTPPRQAIFSHLPSDPVWQLLEEPIDMARFIELPNLRSSFFSLGFDTDAVYRLLDGEGFRGFPEVYNQEYSIQILEAPLPRYLDAGVEYAFSLSIEEANSVVSINGSRWSNFENVDGIWQGQVVPNSGRLKISYSSRGRNGTHWTILEYRVE